MAGRKLYHIAKAIESERETTASSCLVYLHQATLFQKPTVNLHRGSLAITEIQTVQSSPENIICPSVDGIRTRKKKGTKDTQKLRPMIV